MFDRRFPDELVRVLSDEDVRGEVLNALASGGLTQTEEEADTLFRNLSEMSVFEVKRFFLDLSDAAASGATALFILLGLFSVGVGVLLVFLIFVMLAAARRTEMGMARAIGAKRSHLVQMFIFEGTAYNLVSAALGVTVGLGVGYLIVAATNQILGGTSEEFEFAYTFELRSAVVAYCLGMIITFATVAVSAYRVSRMNIVEAVRGLPETVTSSDEGNFLPTASGRCQSRRPPHPIPIFCPERTSYQQKIRLRNSALLGRRRLLAAHPPLAGRRRRGPPAIRLALLPAGLAHHSVGCASNTWVAPAPGIRPLPSPSAQPFVIVGFGLLLRLSIFRWPNLSAAPGLLTLIGGAVLLIYGIAIGSLTDILTAAALVVIGAAMLIPGWANRENLRPEFIDRLAFTFIGVLTLAWWVLPFDTCGTHRRHTEFRHRNVLRYRHCHGSCSRLVPHVQRRSAS